MREGGSLGVPAGDGHGCSQVNDGLLPRQDPAVVRAGERGVPHIEASADSPTAAAFSAAIHPLLTLTERPASARVVPVAGGAGAPGPRAVGTDG